MGAILRNTLRARMRRQKGEIRLDTDSSGSRESRTADSDKAMHGLIETMDLLEKLPAMQRKVYELLVERKMSRAEAAREMGISLDRLDQLAALMKKTLRELFGAD